MDGKKLSAEFFGTFALVFAGTGALTINEISGGAITHVGIALTFGLVVLALIYALGDVSGAHFNPAVTFGFWTARRTTLRTALPYVAAQCAGAILASLLLWSLFPAHSLGGTTPRPGFVWPAFFLEIVLTWLLMFVALCVSTGSRTKGLTAGVAVGAVVALEALFAGPISGASMNPARSLGPALVEGHFGDLWIYLTAPFLGAGLAVVGCRFVHGVSCCNSACRGSVHDNA